MLTLSGAILGLALVIGGWIAIDQMRGAAPPKLAIALAHGLVALAGYVLLLLALGGPDRGVGTGAAAFGRIAAITFALATIPGLWLFVAHLRRRRLSGTLIGVHAFLAVTGFVILLSYILVT